MTTVKFVKRDSLANEKSSYKRQTPNNKGIWKDCKFIFNPLVNDYDWLVIIDDIPKILPNRVEKLNCNEDNTILITTEPSTITRYGRGFAKQFKYLITNQEEKILPHKNSFRMQTGNIWMYGKSYSECLNNSLDIAPQKKNIISTICSNKAMGHTLHKKRLEFTEYMQREIDELVRYGWGFSPIEKKYDAIDDFQFHVCIENYIAPHVWTEKLADTFLGYSIPIYYGCPNIFEYFPEDSIVLIDLDDFEGSLSKIKKIISTPGEYERRFESLKEARRRVLEEYNIFELVHKIISKSPQNKHSKGSKKIYGRRAMRIRYLPDLFRFIYFRIKNFIKNYI
ncbi:glycosyltransferase family 10 domain-containing protein [Arcobacter arenosus]|uniref:glycosyltransferase family 10 domain-containing protein n=1 Tax=Arcobacter arenosus TaxID=2576037 RepID=UPI003BA918B6